jgi:cytochrome c553
MRKSIFILSAMAAIIAIAVVACNSSATGTKKQTVTLDSAALVKRGDYLVNAMGCDDCHSPKRMGAQGPEIIPELRFSGFRHDGQLPPLDTAVVGKGWTLIAPDFTSAVGVWGASFAGNITSDATGIGNWPEENFIRAIRKGKLKGLENGRDLLPPMPWFVYKNLNDEDLKSIFAYLKTTKPVENVVPGPKTLAELK